MEVFKAVGSVVLTLLFFVVLAWVIDVVDWEPVGEWMVSAGEWIVSLDFMAVTQLTLLCLILAAVCGVWAEIKKLRHSF